MNFDFTEEQVMLRDSVARFIQDEYDFDTRRRIASSDEGLDRKAWQTFAELGWLSVPFAEEYGGFGGDAVDVMVIMEQLGRGLVLEPYLATVLLYGGLLQRGGSEAVKSAHIPAIIDGSELGAFAFLERQSRYAITDVKTQATAEGDAYVLSGEKVVVFNGANADYLVVSARTAGAQSDRDGISLFLVPASADGVSRTSYRMMDGQVVANVGFDNVLVSGEHLVGAAGEAAALIDEVVLEANLALSAEALGIMEQLNAKTVEYARTREQFGVAIGKFQALQHRMVDTFISYEQARSLLYRAVCALRDEREDARVAIHALRVMVEKSGKHIFGEAIQIHGGMGITDELDIGHYAKRLMMINATFGNGDYHQAKFNALRYN